MSLKELITKSYSKEVYLDTKKVQQKIPQNAIAKSKNQMVFLYKCLSSNVTPDRFVKTT